MSRGGGVYGAFHKGMGAALAGESSQSRTLRAAEVDRKIVCRRCGHIMRDIEPDTGYGEFLHEKRICSNSGKFFSLAPKHVKEVMPFESKRTRRVAKRAGTHV